MMKFKRPITREIELGGERVAVTMGESGVSFRPVGSRKPPRDLSWAAILCYATGQPPITGTDTSPELITAALQTLKGAPGSSAKPSPEAATGSPSSSEAGVAARSSQEPPAVESGQAPVHHETTEAAHENLDGPS
jgi:hypothetical protein